MGDVDRDEGVFHSGWHIGIGGDNGHGDGDADGHGEAGEKGFDVGAVVEELVAAEV